MVDTRLREMVDTRLFEEIDRVGLSPRASRLREEYFNATAKVAGERARLTVESWKETEGEPLDIRWAKLLKKVAEGVPVVIFPGQRLVGSETKYFLGSTPHVDLDGAYLQPLLKEAKGTITMGGPEMKGGLAGEDLSAIREAVKFWKGKTQREACAEVAHAAMGSWYDDLVETGTPRNEGQPQVAACISWPRPDLTTEHWTHAKSW